MTLLLEVVAGLFASEALAAIKSLLRSPDPSWTEAAVARLSPYLRISLTEEEQAGVSRWLNRGDVFAALIEASEDEAGEAAAGVVAALEYEMGEPSPERRERAENVVAALLVHAAEVTDPAVAATLVAHRSQMQALSDLKDGQAAIYEQLVGRGSTGDTTEFDDAVLAQLPIDAANWLRQAELTWPQAETIVRFMRDSAKLEVLLIERPAWVEEQGEVWAAIAACADAHSRNEVAIEAFDRAAQLLPEFRARLLGRAAFAAGRNGEAPLARELIERGRLGASQADKKFLGVIEAAIAEDARAILETNLDLNELTGSERALVGVLQAHAKIALDDVCGALALLAGEVPLHPHHAGLRTAYAKALLIRGQEDSATTRIDDASLALEVALEARNLRRLWGGDSREAVELACKAALMLGDYGRARQLGTIDPGEATAAEANHPDVRQIVAMVSVDGSHPLPAPESDFERLFFDGMRLGSSADTTPEAIASLRQAAALASDPLELDRTHRVLASLGVADLPRLDEVRESDNDHAEVLLAVAEIANGQLHEAAERLRPRVGRNRLAVLHLAQILSAQGDALSSASVLRAGGQRFSDPVLSVAAGRAYLSADQFDDAAECVRAAIASTPAQGEVRAEARRLEVMIGAHRNDAASVEMSTRTAIAEGETSTEIRWLRVQALARLLRTRDAWVEVKREPELHPDSEDRAYLYLQLLVRNEPNRFDVVAQVLDDFSDSHDVNATGISLFFAFERDYELDPDHVAAMQQHVRNFTDRYPRSPVLQARTVTVDDPDVLLDEMRELFEPDREADAVLLELAERAGRGQVPIGFVAALVGRQYFQTILTGQSVGLVSVPGDERVLEEEINLALASLDKPAVVDTSSLVVASFIPDHWDKVVASFTSLAVVDSARIEIDDFAYRRLPDGTLRWNSKEDRPELIEIGEDEIAALKARRLQIKEWANELSLVERAMPEELRELTTPDSTNTWLDSVGTAKSVGRPLLCDDVALSALARSVNVDSFGTFALLTALARTNRISSTRLATIVHTLFEARAVDLPLSPEEVVQQAAVSGWRLECSVHPLARIHIWRNLKGAIGAFREILIGAGTDADRAASVLYAGVIGLAKAIVSGPHEVPIASLFTTAVVSHGRNPADAGKLVAAVRAACDSVGEPDPLVPCVKMLVETFSLTGQKSTAVQVAMYLMSELEEEDQRLVAQAIID